MTRYCLGRGHKKIILLWFLLSYHAVLFAAPQYPNDSTSSTLIPSVTADDSKKSYLLAFGTIKANDPELSATLLENSTSAGANPYIKVSYVTGNKVCPLGYYAFVEYALVNARRYCSGLGACYGMQAMRAELWFAKISAAAIYDFGGALTSVLPSEYTWAAVSFSITCHPCTSDGTVPNYQNNETPYFTLTTAFLNQCDTQYNILYRPYIVD